MSSLLTVDGKSKFLFRSSNQPPPWFKARMLPTTDQESANGHADESGGLVVGGRHRGDVAGTTGVGYSDRNVGECDLAG